MTSLISKDDKKAGKGSSIKSVGNSGGEASKSKFAYSHLSNKRDVTLTDFGTFHPEQNKDPPCKFLIL